MLQVREDMLWVWGESGPTAFIDSAAKMPAVTRVSTVSTVAAQGAILPVCIAMLHDSLCWRLK